MKVEMLKKVEVVVREYQAEKDLSGAEAVDRMCDVGASGTVSLFTDLLGDPVCRVRHSPAFLMLVAETTGPNKEIVGLIRGCIKTITCGKKNPRVSAASTATAAANPIYTKAAYILGLRVSPFHRRMGIGLKLVQRMEDWFRSNGAEYAYMATDKDNEASLRLFTGRCGYVKFRNPTILVQPVFAHRQPIGRRTAVIRLSPTDSETFYRRRFSTTEFFPRDIDAILHNPLSLGTFLALPVSSASAWTGSIDSFLANSPESWAVLSVWDSKSLFRLEIRNAPLLWRGLAWTTRAVDRAVPWLRIPPFPTSSGPSVGTSSTASEVRDPPRLLFFEPCADTGITWRAPVDAASWSPRFPPASLCYRGSHTGGGSPSRRTCGASNAWTRNTAMVPSEIGPVRRLGPPFSSIPAKFESDLLNVGPILF
ncbi:hypothetical protein HPP92_023667 [Vanilla planifolia]|uniref:N-acetyltransferase domain-containing protein n=1 Tax=Vanilla planifolia TaxID=51239 RepID=A0A835PQS7_VANPL|nr:hypothetical protein HPP92_023667 [Vanilla planifolia]